MKSLLMILISATFLLLGRSASLACSPPLLLAAPDNYDYEQIPTNTRIWFQSYNAGTISLETVGVEQNTSIEGINSYILPSSGSRIHIFTPNHPLVVGQSYRALLRNENESTMAATQFTVNADADVLPPDLPIVSVHTGDMGYSLFRRHR